MTKYEIYKKFFLKIFFFHAFGNLYLYSPPEHVSSKHMHVFLYSSFDYHLSLLSSSSIDVVPPASYIFKALFFHLNFDHFHIICIRILTVFSSNNTL